MSDDNLKRLVELLANAKNIACLTGAGMSTESGIPDFRSSNGLYNTVTSEEVFDIEAFHRDPDSFYKVIGPLYCAILEAEPNKGHKALAELEERFGKNVHVATQNIDALHQRAGSSVVHEVHGTMTTMTCTKCGASVPSGSFLELFRKGEVPFCKCGGVMKPDITFFGEALPEDQFINAMRAFEKCDLALVCGTSLSVYPAASLPSFRRTGVPLVIINRTETPQDMQATLVFSRLTGSLLSEALSMM